MALKVGYNPATLVVAVNGTRVQAERNDNGTYTVALDNIKENKQVVISDLSKYTYKVSTSVGAGCTIVSTDSTTVAYGDTYSFNVKVDPGYGEAKVMVGATSVNLEDGMYKVVVTDDITIAVTAEAKTYKADKGGIGASEVTFTSGNETKIPYGGTYSFRVTANAGHRVTAVLVNGAALTGTNGVYTVTNVTSDQTITVETAENKLTITYVSNEKNHGVVGDIDKTYTYAELSAVDCNADKALEGCTIHKSLGWADANGRIATNPSLKALIENATADVSITLTAKFELVDDVASKVLTLAATTKKVTGPAADGTYTVIFRTDITPVATEACIAELVKVTAHGTLLGRGNVDFNKVLEMVEDRKGSDTRYGFKQQELPVNGTYSVYNSYYDVNYSWNTFLSFMTEDKLCLIQINDGLKSEDNDRNAAGWIEITIGDQSFVIIADASGTGVTATN